MIRGESMLGDDGGTGRAPCEEFSSETRWICVRTQSKKELFAAQNLLNQSYNCYLPTIARTIRHARRSRVITAPLFPGYLFVSLELDVRQWRPILGTFGVIDLIMEDGRPKPVPAGVVEALQEATSADGFTDFRHQVSVGQDVRIMSGPFFNLVGRLERLDDQGRVTVLLDILGGQRLVSADATALQPLAA